VLRGYEEPEITYTGPINCAIFQRSVSDDLARVACVPIHSSCDVHYDCQHEKERDSAHEQRIILLSQSDVETDKRRPVLRWPIRQPTSRMRFRRCSVRCLPSRSGARVVPWYAVVMRRRFSAHSISEFRRGPAFAQGCGVPRSGRYSCLFSQQCD
jgi:hypothetical protein